MKCYNCGAEYANMMPACPRCNAVNTLMQQQQQYQQQQQQYTANNTQRPPYPTAVELIKKVGQSKLLFVATILLTISAAVNAIVGSFDLISILMVVGLWMFYADSRRDRGPFKMDAASLRMLRVSQTIQIVLIWVVVGILALLMFLLAILGWSAAQNSANTAIAVSVIAVISLVFFGITLALELVVLYGVRNYFKSAIASAETGLRPQKLSKAAPILLIISAIYSLIGVVCSIVISPFLSDILSELLYETEDYLYQYSNDFLIDKYYSLQSSFVVSVISGSIVSIISAVTTILFAKVMLDAKALADQSYYPSEEEAFFNRQMYMFTQHSYTYTQPQYGQAPYQQPQYGQAPYQTVSQHPQYQPQQDNNAATDPISPAEQTKPADTDHNNTDQL